MLFEQDYPGLEYRETYGSIESYLDGRIGLVFNGSRRSDKDLYYGIDVHIFSPHRCGHSTTLVVNPRNLDVHDDWPIPEDATSPTYEEDVFDSTSSSPEELPF